MTEKLAADSGAERAARIDTGDVVLHTPTGERWVVACVVGHRLSWCGWPEGTANLADCVLAEKATPDKREKLLREMAAMSSSDHRRSYALSALPAAPDEGGKR